MVEVEEVSRGTLLIEVVVGYETVVEGAGGCASGGGALSSDIDEASSSALMTRSRLIRR